MSEKRTVTVSITINLGNYENLRLEVSDTAETKEDADALRHFLSDILDGYANNNATAKAAVEKYKERILADAESESTAEAEDTGFGFSMFEEEPVLPYTAPAAEEAEAVPETDFFVPELPAEEPEKTEEPMTAVPETPAPAGEFTCTKCGAPVTKLQRDVSMLFNHKILCKDCMK